MIVFDTNVQLQIHVTNELILTPPTGLLRSSFKKVHWTFLFALQNTPYRSQ